jgi:peptidoglycan hydrolase-like amidase
MRLLKIASAALLTAVVSGTVFHHTLRVQTYTFLQPIDALSVGVDMDQMHLSVSALVGSRWTEWETLHIEKEFDPLLRESNLVLFPQPVSKVRIRGSTAEYVVHPIRISRAPIRYAVAARGSMGIPRILSRRQWGADESLTYAGRRTSRSDEPTGQIDNGDYDKVPQRVKDCEAAQRNNPEEFRTEHTVTKDPSGKQYRWQRRYSPAIRQLVVHHTAQKVSGDKRAPAERVRALYEYHANNRGWGDIGYHYVIDEEGQIYEGRAGGDSVVGGHVYCSNVGSIGVVMMGNFEIEKPTYAQTSSLKWLLAELANKYQLDLESPAVFHGTSKPVIVGHGDLIATECPGYYVRKTLGIVRKQVVAGEYSTKITYPSTAQRTSSRVTPTPSRSNLTPLGGTELIGRPGGLLHISLQYKSGNGIQRRGRIATVTRSNSTMGLWQDTGGYYADVRKELIAPEDIRSGETETIRIRVQLPRIAGIYTIDIGSVTYVINAEGRRAPSPKTAPTRQSFSPEPQQNLQTPGYRRMQAGKQYSQGVQPRSSHSSLSDAMRIRLSYDGDTATIETTRNPMVNGILMDTRKILLQKKDLSCAVVVDNQIIDSGIVQIDPGDGILTISSWNKPENRFRGMMECRVMYGELVLINELSLEDYMAGVAEEPDSEPFEKQKAFAIAARSYAAHYLEPANRKFPGMPYDGSDTGASFQNYGGYVYEQRNPLWIRAVQETENLVVKKLNRIVKAAYFSSDDGRTRSPEENGWKNFLFADVFKSKPDPWCKGLALRGHGVGMSGCGALGQAKEGKSAEEILEYYYPGTNIEELDD